MRKPLGRQLPGPQRRGLDLGRFVGDIATELNLGVRYDIQKGAAAEELILEPLLAQPRPVDKNNFAPRLALTIPSPNAQC